MKKNLFTSLAFISVTGSVFAQLPVSISVQNRKAVLEEFTGIYCGYCPDGHQIANTIKNNNPGNVVLINIHSGGYANVVVGEPDLKTADGSLIDPMTGMNILGYPAGDVNRTIVAGAAQQTISPYGMAQNRNAWASSVSSILTQTSYVNVALQGTVNVNTRVLTVVAQVYYTGNSPAGTNSLTVMLLENDIIGPQHNYGTPYYNLAQYNPDGTYNHKHALRKALTPTFGLTIPVTTMGTTFTTTLTYTIPATYGAAGKTNPCLLGNIELAAFVTETDRPTVTGANGPIMLSGFTNSLDVATNNLLNDAAVCTGTNFASSFKFLNNGSSTVTTAVFSYAVNGGAPSNYTYTGAAINPLTSSPTLTLPLFSFVPQVSNTLAINVVSVNGGTDQVAGNNAVSAIVPLTGIVANALNMQMDFTQDRWGTEDSWKVYDEATNAVIAQDGPFADLNATGILLHPKTFTVGINTCYKLVVSDSYGDGINSGSGVGGYILKSGGISMITSNGTYGFSETKLYKSSSNPTGISTGVLSIAGVNLFPNPTSGLTNLAIELSQNETVGITVLNSLGQVVYTSKGNNLNAGVNNISLNSENWGAGVYFINVSTPKGSVNQKLNVTK